jgi:hypothetical protein
MSPTNSILILGAGELGLSLAQSLKAHPSAHQTPISLLLRPTPSTPSPPKAAQLATLAALSIPIIPGDLVNDSISTLAETFRPFHTIISCTGFVAGRGTQLKIARAALQAGVKRYFPWQFGVDYDVIGRGSAQDLFDEQLDVRDLLRGQSGTEWVVVSTGMFMSFLFEPWFGVVEVGKEGEGETKVRALGSWGNEVTVTTVEDIGRVTAEIVFVEEPRVRNEIVFMAGETVSYGRVAEVVDKVLGERVVREVWDVDGLEEELKKDPENAIKKYRVVFAKGKGVAWGPEKTFNAQKAIETTGVEEWARANLKNKTLL